MVARGIRARRWERWRLQDFFFDIVVYALATFALIATLYPFIYVFSMSISSTEAVVRNRVYLFPVGLSLDAFRYTLNNSNILQYYYPQFRTFCVHYTMYIINL